MNVDGLRGDLVVNRAVKALVAFESRDQVHDVFIGTGFRVQGWRLVLKVLLDCGFHVLCCERLPQQSPARMCAAANVTPSLGGRTLTTSSWEALTGALCLCWGQAIPYA